MSVQILGPVQVLRGDELRVPSPRLARLLLGSLALRANRTVSVAWVKDALWSDRPPKSAAANLRGYLAGLRRLLPPARSSGLSIDSGPAGYCLHAEPDALDALLFDCLLSDGRRLLLDGEYPAAAERLTRALALWRGPVLDGITVPESLQPDVHVLEIKRQDAIEDCVQARLSLGQHRELVSELTMLVAQGPLRERLCGQLMLALCRSGRQVEALAAYQALRKRLDDELGVLPAAEIQALYRRVLRADPDLQVITPLRRADRSRLVPL
ncbi:MAG: AfsR/SARP family transcriptional regulator [Jatrophihabitans sp.]